MYRLINPLTVLSRLKITPNPLKKTITFTQIPLTLKLFDIFLRLELILIILFNLKS